jgi:hypothetical protein
MGKRYNRDLSDSQANAEALARRERTYSEASGVSFRVNWDWHNREPRDLREAVRMARQAYADEVPARLHSHDLADDGTPKMTPQAEGYIFGSETAGEERRTPDEAPPALDFYRTPFRACLANLERSSPRRAAIVSHVTIGSLSPVEAAMREGVPTWCAKEVAESTLRAFLRNLTDVKVHLPREDAAA